MYTEYTVDPLGVPSLVHAVEPLYARSKFPPLDVAENVDAVTPLPHISAPDTTPHEPLEVDIVNELALPETVMVASVCVDQVPAVRSPPVDAPEEVRPVILALVGRPVWMIR